MPDVVVLAGDALIEAAAQWLARALTASAAQRGAVHLALSGGSTPQPLYRHLARAPFAAGIPWHQVHVWFADERAVPPGHKDSNYHAAAASLLSHVPLPAGQVHRMPAERADLEAAAADYGAQLPAELDVLLLGIGEDGHTASLFPGSPALRESRPVVAVTGAKPPARRLTITPPVIAAARGVMMLATGSAKAGAVGRALDAKASPAEVPACLARRGSWFLDPEAAARLDTVRPV